jgi:very-short-patch-repair endonuclease
MVLWSPWVSMDTQGLHKRAWDLATAQHGVLSRRQLLELGWHAEAIKHRVRKGRLHTVHRGVFAVGRPNLTRRGHWMAAVLACAPDAFLSHRTAAVLWGIRIGPLPSGDDLIDVTVRAHRRLRCKGVRLHRARSLTEPDWASRDRIPVTSPIRTLIDLAAELRSEELETAINEADRARLVSPEVLRSAASDRSRLHGIAAIRAVLDRRTFRLTDSELERRFLRLIDRAGLTRPLTQRRVNGFRVDFYWPELALVVETDGLRYHRTPGQQATDRIRDQKHAAAGLIPLRFTHAQVVFEAERVIETLRAVVARQRPDLWSV